MSSIQFKRLAVLLCPLKSCQYLDFPGCGRHDELLSVPIENGHMACATCIREENPMNTITDTLDSHWKLCHGCQNEPIQVKELLIHEDILKQLSEWTKDLAVEGKFSAKINQCQDCHSFAITNAEISNDTPPIIHHACDKCRVNLEPITFTANISKSEVDCLRDCINNSPSLRLFPSKLSEGIKIEPVHSFFQCDLCQTGPIRGARLHCTQCENVDFCEPCLNNFEGKEIEMKTGEIHLVSHAMVKFNASDRAGYHLVQKQNLSKEAKIGYDSNLFEKHPFNEQNQNLINAVTCAVCLNVSKNAKITPCGHIFCSDCIAHHVSLRSDCPLDRLPLPSNLMEKISIFDLEVRATVNNLHCVCVNGEKCSWQGKLNNLMNHLENECEFKECPFAKYGCSVKLWKNEEKNSAENTEQKHNHTELLSELVNNLNDQQSCFAKTLADAMQNFRQINLALVTLSNDNAAFSRFAQDIQEVIQLQKKDLVEKSKVKEEERKKDVEQVTSLVTKVENLEKLQKKREKMAIIAVGCGIACWILSKLIEQKNINM